MEHARCDDTLVKRVPSPNGKLEVQIYDRSCSADTGRSTYAVVHDPAAPSSWPRRTDVCSLLSVPMGYHELNAVWKDGTHLEISNRDELEYDDGEHTAVCGEIRVTYQLTIKAGRPR